MRRIDRVLQISQVLVLAFLLSLPVLVYAAMGPADDFVFGSQRSEFPRMIKLIAPKSRGRRQLARALLDRSAVRREAIALRHRVLWYGMNFVQEERVVSGAPGWLFYRPAFSAWDCAQHQRLRSGLQRLALILDLVAVNSLPVTIASAPNKASIQREQIRGRAQYQSRCYFDFEREYRSMTQAYASRHLVDHARVLVDLTATAETYLRIDTHWTSQASFFAISQLVTDTGVGRLPVGELPRAERLKVTDLGNQMLLLSERVVDIGVVVDESSFETSNDSSTVGVIILHDSFYREAADYLKAFFPDARLFNYRLDAAESIPFDQAEYLILESVEREILTRVFSAEHWGWDAPVGEWLISKLTAGTETCHWSRSEGLLPNAKLSAMEVLEAGGVRSHGPTSRLLVEIPSDRFEGEVCFELSLVTSATQEVRLFLSTSGSPLDPKESNREFIEGRSITHRFSAGSSRFSFVLPASNVGKRVRLDFRSPFNVERIVQLRIAPKD